MTAYTGKTDNRGTMRERTAKAYGVEGYACVRVGRRKAFVDMPLSKAREIIHRMYRQPAPLIWRALGVEV